MLVGLIDVADDTAGRHDYTEHDKRVYSIEAASEPIKAACRTANIVRCWKFLLVNAAKFAEADVQTYQFQHLLCGYDVGDTNQIPTVGVNTAYK